MHPGACSLAVHIVLRETGQAVDLVVVDLARKTLSDGRNFFQINPKGQVPALRLEDGLLLTEGPAINQRLADAAPESGLLAPVATAGRYLTLEWLSFVGSELHKAMSPLMRPLSPDVHDQAITRARSKLAIVEARLEGRPYLTGDTFTIADAYLFVVVTWLDRVGIARDDYPRLGEFSACVSGRPAVIQALAAERELSA